MLGQTKVSRLIFQLSMSPSQPHNHLAQKYILHLYVANGNPQSLLAIRRLHSLCEEHLVEGCEIKLVDIYQQPDLAEQEKVFAIPTLIKKAPLPEKKLIGDLSDLEKVGILIKNN